MSLKRRAFGYLAIVSLPLDVYLSHKEKEVKIPQPIADAPVQVRP